MEDGWSNKNNLKFLRRMTNDNIEEHMYTIRLGEGETFDLLGALLDANLATNDCYMDLMDSISEQIEE